MTEMELLLKIKEGIDLILFVVGTILLGVAMLVYRKK